ncbi:MAG: aminoacyl-tRNA hydrolase, partial [Parcubacteria group bacterium]|nr:aminoacyl-tRNA hydrolase [Parcubacteria group bacterium]
AKAILAKPQTFMNKSGVSVRSLLKQGGELIVVHDDIDIPIGTVRVSKDRGSAGHKGVESVMEELKSRDFTRIRIGIRPLLGKPKNVEDFVLQKFSPEELPLVQSAIQEATGCIWREL